MATEEYCKQEQEFYKTNYVIGEVEALLDKHNLNKEDFWNWMFGQTGGLLIQEDGTQIFGYYKSDVDYYIQRKTKGQIPFNFD